MSPGIERHHAAQHRRPLTVLVVLAAAAAGVGCGATKTVTTTEKVTVPAPAATSVSTQPAVSTVDSGVGAPEDFVQFGYLRSLTRAGHGYQVQIDPALFLSGVTASRAARQDTGSSDVPNDHYIVDESHRSLTYLMPATARVTVLRDGVGGSTVTVAQLAQLVAGRNPFGDPLFEPLDTGFWFRVHIDTVRSLDQQYKP